MWSIIAAKTSFGMLRNGGASRIGNAARQMTAQAEAAAPGMTSSAMLILGGAGLLATFEWMPAPRRNYSGDEHNQERHSILLMDS